MTIMKKAKDVKAGDVFIDDGVKHKLTNVHQTKGFRMSLAGHRHAYAIMLEFGKEHVLFHPEADVEVAG